MPRSIKIDISQKPLILQAMQRNGFLTQGYLAAHLEIALSTVNNFINGKPIYISKFEEICDALDLDPIEIATAETNHISTPNNDPINPQITLKPLAYDDCWVGRENLIQSLTEKLKHQCRILLILGLTGIGKTALAENLITQNNTWLTHSESPDILRINGEEINLDFVSVATTWLKHWEISITPESQQPKWLLEQTLTHLRNQNSILLFDSFEYFLTGTEAEEGNHFTDPLWQEFFVQILAAPNFASRILITSQELPVEIVQQRFSQFWSSQILTGLDIPEQKHLFERTGFELAGSEPELEILLRIAQAYRGHPLVLRVILGEIWESFGGNILAYWDEVQPKIEEVEQAIAAAESDIKTMIGFEDQWRLHKLTRKVRLEINRQRLQMVFERLSTSPDAYYLICAASVYRVPVQTKGWLMQLTALVQRLEGRPCPEERQEKALNNLFYRFLVEAAHRKADLGESAPNHQRLLAMHPLVRSVALEHHKTLLASLQNISQSA